MKICFAVAALLSLVSLAPAQDPETRTIEVTGTAVVRGDVDEVSWRITVRGEGESLEQASQRLAEARAALEDRLSSLDLPDDALRFSRTNSGRIYEQGPDRSRKHTGFYAEKGGLLRLENLEKSEPVEAALLADDGVEIQGLERESSRREELKLQAGRDAVAVAREKAASMAGVLDASLGEVLRIEEGIAEFQTRNTSNRLAMAEVGGSGGDGYEQIELRVTVTVRFALQ